MTPTTHKPVPIKPLPQAPQARTIGLTAYSTKSDFVDALTPLFRVDEKNGQVESHAFYDQVDHKHIDDAWHAYQSIGHSDLGLVVGRHHPTYRGTMTLIPSADESFACIDQHLADNFGLTTTSTEPERGGAVVLLERWSLLVNDALTLAAIHFGKDVHFALSFTPESFHDPTENCLTVSGRELIGIKSCDRYAFIGGPGALGVTARFDHSREETRFGFEEYLASINQYLDDKSLLKALARLDR